MEALTPEELAEMLFRAMMNADEAMMRAVARQAVLRFAGMVWIFQEGHLSRFLHFTPTGLLDSTSPILMFCIAFGLSMDYEVFLLSRIKEEHDAGRDTVGSVAMGLERTGRLVTAAAALIAVVFLAFSTSQITFIKLFGIGLALAVVLDATIIRATLVPAFMTLHRSPSGDT